MKNRFFTWLAAIGFASICLSCDVLTGKENEETLDPAIEEASLRMQSQWSKGAEYDLANVASLLYGPTGYWRADAELEYDGADYSRAKKINRAFDAPFWEGSYEPVLSIADGSSIHRYTIRPSDGVMVEQEGVCSFDLRTLELSVSLEQSDDFGALNAKYVVSAVSDDSLILDWKSDSGKYIRTLYTPVAFGDMARVEATLRVSRKLAEIQEFDEQFVNSNIVGSWVVNTSLSYDASWETIENVYELFGESYVAGDGYQLFTFNADGTVNVYTEPEDPTFEPYESVYSWVYDAESKSIKVAISEELTKEYRLAGFGADYMFVDYYDLTNDKYIRDGLTRAE